MTYSGTSARYFAGTALKSRVENIGWVVETANSVRREERHFLALRAQQEPSPAQVRLIGEGTNGLHNRWTNLLRPLGFYSLVLIKIVERLNQVSGTHSVTSESCAGFVGLPPTKGGRTPEVLNGGIGIAITSSLLWPRLCKFHEQAISPRQTRAGKRTGYA